MDGKSLARFVSKIDYRGPIPESCQVLGECHVWTASKDHNGYGRFHLNGKSLLAHRVAFWRRFGRWPVVACHLCNNPSCVNPEHIYDGDTESNGQDRAGADSCKGERNGNARLTEDEVLDIRIAFEDNEEDILTTAERYGISEDYVEKIGLRHVWAHL